MILPTFPRTRFWRGRGLWIRFYEITASLDKPDHAVAAELVGIAVRGRPSPVDRMIAPVLRFHRHRPPHRPRRILLVTGLPQRLTRGLSILHLRRGHRNPGSVAEMDEACEDSLGRRLQPQFPVGINTDLCHFAASMAKPS